MPKSGHEHEMRPLSWSTKASEPLVDDKDKPYVVLIMSCQRGICARTETYRITKRHRAVPDGVTPQQFAQMRAGAHWPEAMNA